MNTSSTNLGSLFQTAQDAGNLSPAGAAVLAIPDLGAAIQGGIGIQVKDVKASEAVLASVMLDDSGSMAKNAAIARTGTNLVFGALRDSKQRDGIIATCRYLNGTILFPYVPIVQAVELTAANYDPNGGTPLYDQSVVMLGSVVAKTQEFEDAGVPVRSVTLIVSDGADLGSRLAKPKDVRTLVRDMRAKENHIIAAMGIDDGSTPFRDIFRDMGIEDRWILTPGNNAGEIRKAFLLFSQSAVRASQNANTFSQTAAGGFGAP